MQGLRVLLRASSSWSGCSGQLLFIIHHEAGEGKRRAQGKWAGRAGRGVEGRGGLGGWSRDAALLRELRLPCRCTSTTCMVNSKMESNLVSELPPNSPLSRSLTAPLKMELRHSPRDQEGTYSTASSLGWGEAQWAVSAASSWGPGWQQQVCVRLPPGAALICSAIQAAQHIWKRDVGGCYPQHSLIEPPLTWEEHRGQQLRGLQQADGGPLEHLAVAGLEVAVGQCAGSGACPARGPGLQEGSVPGRGQGCTDVAPSSAAPTPLPHLELSAQPPFAAISPGTRGAKGAGQAGEGPQSTKRIPFHSHPAHTGAPGPPPHTRKSLTFSTKLHPARTHRG